MRKEKKNRAFAFFFWGSAVCFFLTALAVFLFYPASYLSLNRGTDLLRYVASLMFWISLALGLIFRLICLILRRREAPDFAKKLRWSRSEMKTGKRIARVLFKNALSVIMALLFLVGLTGSILCMLESMISSYKTFFFIALTVLGFLEYFVFNSIGYDFLKSKYTKHRRKGNET